MTDYVGNLDSIPLPSAFMLRAWKKEPIKRHPRTQVLVV